jgi:rubredoxin
MMEAIIGIIYSLFLRLLARRRPVPYVFHCPSCKQAKMGKMHESVTFGQQMRIDSAMRIFRCEACKNVFDFDSFQPDADGVYQMKMWDCPRCQHMSPNSTYKCEACGFVLK